MNPPFLVLMRLTENHHLTPLWEGNRKSPEAGEKSLRTTAVKIKDRIKQIRNHFGLTQEKFAKRINKTTGFISSVETGRSGLSSDTIQDFRVYFEILGVGGEK